MANHELPIGPEAPADSARPLLPLFDGTVILVPFEQQVIEPAMPVEIDEDGRLLNYGDNEV